MVRIDTLPDGRIRVRVDCVLQKGTIRRVFTGSGDTAEGTEMEATPMVRALGKAWRMRQLIASNTYRGQTSLCAVLGVSRTHFREHLKLTYLSPVIVEKIMRGELPAATVKKFGGIASPLWYEQHKALGID